ncbi:MAG TPA: TonB-dependent receptor [Holophagaceae bacterium]|nr:TonB-dependent receptor [Holophagaceae bacterium]HJW32255.1 TonB-dependent receptor [Holophagaceae bacterium]
MNRVVSRLGFTTLALVAGVAAHAQSSTTGSITGVVKDKSGAPVAGATITAASSQTSRTVQTGADGTFRLGLLNPGEWTVKVSKAGMQANNQKLTVFTNQNSPVTFTLDKEATAVVEVVGVQNSVDFTSTQQGKVMSTETFDALPKGRDMNSLAFFTPGVVSSGFGDPSISGASGAENQYVMDGLETTDFRRGFQGGSVVTDFIEQVEVQTGGFRPEFSALGGVFNAVTKSGSNDFKGSSWITWDARGSEAAPKFNRYFKQPNPNSRLDIGAEVGGAIIKDKLFYFAGVDLNREEAPGDVNFDPGLKNSDLKNDTTQFMGKVNWFITPDHQLTFTLNRNEFKDERAHIYTLRGTADVGGNFKNTTLNMNVNYDWNISSALTLSVKAGTTDLKSTFDPTDNSIRYTDNMWYRLPAQSALGFAGANHITGGAGFYNALDQNKTTQIKADLSWFIGTHALKFGVSTLESTYNSTDATTGGYQVRFLNVNSNSLAGMQVQQRFNSTDAGVKATFNAFYAQDQWEMFGGFRLMYGFRYETQDQKDYQGKSFMKFDNFGDVVQPRIGFTWDVNNDGKTKVSGSYAKYFERIPQRVAIRVFANEVFLEHDWDNNGTTDNPGGVTWGGVYDQTTGAITLPARTFDATVDNATPFSYDPIAKGTKLPERSEFTLGVDQTFASGWTLGIKGRYRELKNPIEDSVILRPWYNLGRTGGTAAQTAGLGFDPYTANSNGTTGAADVNFRNPYDPGVNGANSDPFTGWGYPAILGYYGGQAILWNPGKSVSWTSRSIAGEPNTTYNVANSGYPEARNYYQAVDATIEKKTERSFFSLSYTWSKLYGNYEGVVSSSNGQADGNITASYDYDTYVGYGLLPLDRTNAIKLQMSHRFDLVGNDFNVGVTWSSISGTPISLFDDGTTTAQLRGETIVSRGGFGGATYIGLNGNSGRGNLKYDPGYYGNATPADGKLGQYGRTPTQNDVALHLDYNMKFGGIRVSPSADVFNVFNSRTALGQVQQKTASGAANPSFGYENGWQEGRRFRFGVKVKF